jgi:hypothetical protein
MKMKLKALAAAAALAFAGSASAGIATSGTGNGELFFSVWDSITETSYTRDLGLTLSQFVDQVGNFGTSAGGTHGGSNLLFAADAVLSGWLGGLAPASLAGLQWNVAAMDGSGQNRYLTTATGSPAGVTPTVQSQLIQLNDGADTYITNVNSGPWVSGNHTDANGSAVIANGGDFANTAGYAGASGTWSNNFGGRTGFGNAGGIGDLLGFFVLFGTGTTSLAPVGVDQFDGAFWSFAGDGTLTYSQAAVIPLPGAVWLLGSGLLGLVAVSRRKRQLPGLAVA